MDDHVLRSTASTYKHVVATKSLAGASAHKSPCDVDGEDVETEGLLTTTTEISDVPLQRHDILSQLGSGKALTIFPICVRS
jgi:hypothetical protein